MEEQTKFGKEFLSYEVAREMHEQNLEFHAFAYWNKIGEEWKIGQNALTLEAIKAPLLQQYLKLANL